jgi:hypothetical protein
MLLHHGYRLMKAGDLGLMGSKGGESERQISGVASIHCSHFMSPEQAFDVRCRHRGPDFSKSI